MSEGFNEKTQSLKIMCARFHHQSSNNSFLLLCHSISILNLYHILRTFPCFVLHPFNDDSPPLVSASHHQKVRVLCKMTSIARKLLEATPDAQTKA